MLITRSTQLVPQPRPTEFPLRSRSVLRPAKAREICSICKGTANREHPARRVSKFRNREHVICGPCAKRYHDAAGQIEQYGFRFRFVTRREINAGTPSGLGPDVSLTVVKQLYKILLLAFERQILRQKEVNMSATDVARKLAKLPDRIAVIVSKTYSVCGDDFKLADDQAVTRIRDLLEEIDPQIIERNKKKRLP